MTKQNDDDDDDDDGDDDDDEDHATMMTSAQATFRPIRKCAQPNCEEIIYCYSVILLSLVKIAKANVEIIYSLVLTSFSRKQPVDLLSVNLFVKS